MLRSLCCCTGKSKKTAPRSVSGYSPALDQIKRATTSPNCSGVISRAQIQLGELSEARHTLDFIQEQAQEYQLVTDTNRNLIVEALLAITEGDDLQACHKLKQALRLTNQTGMIGNFLIDGSKIGHLLEKLVHKVS